MAASGNEDAKNTGTLFPAFISTNASSKENTDAPIPASRDQNEWLSFSSFKTEDALAIHEIQKTKGESKSKDDGHDDIDVIQKTHALSGQKKDAASEDSESDSSEDGVSPQPKVLEIKKEKHKKKKSKEKKKHKRKEKKKKHKHDDNSYEEYMSRHSSSSVPRKPAIFKVPSILIGFEKAVFIEDVKGLTPDKAFRIDKRPDRNNLACGNIYKMHIAKHHTTIGRGSILGSKNIGRYEFLSKKDKKAKEKKQSSRYYGADMRKLIQRNSEMAEVLQPTIKRRRFEDRHVECVPLYIPFLNESHTRRTEKKDLDNPLGIYDKATALYISGAEAPPSVTSAGPDNIHVDEMSQEQISIRKRTTRFNQKLHENPSDIDLWLELIKFQDEIALSEPYERSKEEIEMRSTGRVANMDIKVAILEKAISKNPTSLVLKLKQLEMCIDYWDRDKLKSEWKKLLFTHTNNPEVWQYYLDYLQTNFTSFSIPSILKAYGKCISTLKGVLEGTLLSHRPLPGTQDAMLDIYIKLCFVMKSAGNMEKAIALFQLFIEYNLFRPAVLDSVISNDRIDFLEAFWETPVGRLGERNAQGWNIYVENKGEVPTCEALVTEIDEESLEEELLKNDQVQGVKWVTLEKSRSKRHWLPWRPNMDIGEADEDCEDPDRLVLFDDISSCLFVTEEERHKFVVVVALLKLLSVDVLECEDLIPYTNHYTMNSAHLETLSIANQLCDSQDSYDNTRVFLDNIFAKVTPRFTGIARSFLLRVEIYNRLESVALKNSNLSDKKAAKSLVKEFKKFAKNILKDEQNRNDLLLWEAYAMSEYRLGNADEAKRILQTAIQMSAVEAGNVEDPRKRCLLWKLHCTWLDMEMKIVGNLGLALMFKQRGDVANKDDLLSILCAACDGNSGEPSPARILRCRNKYQQTLSTLLEEYDTESTEISFDRELFHTIAGHTVAHLLKCYAYFQYFTVGHQFSSVIFTETLGKLKPLVPRGLRTASAKYQWKVYESCVVNHMALLRFHVENSVSPLSVLRIPLQQALLNLPENQDLLSVYTSLESKSSIAGRMRRYFHKACTNATSLAPWFSVLSAEFTRLENLEKHSESISGTKGVAIETGVSHQIRAWFERATKHQSARHCVLLWRMYMLFEKRQGCDAESRGVFYKSVQQCPWAKSLYVDYAEYFPEKLHEVCDLLAEKELRLHLPLEELEILSPSAPVHVPDPRLALEEDSDDEQMKTQDSA